MLTSQFVSGRLLLERTLFCSYVNLTVKRKLSLNLILSVSIIYIVFFSLKPHKMPQFLANVKATELVLVNYLTAGPGTMRWLN
jgi:hypothetical protein